MASNEENTDVPDSKTYVHALLALARNGIVRGTLSMSRTEAFVLWWMALGAGIVGVLGAGIIGLRRELDLTPEEVTAARHVLGMDEDGEDDDDE